MQMQGPRSHAGAKRGSRQSRPDRGGLRSDRRIGANRRRADRIRRRGRDGPRRRAGTAGRSDGSKFSRAGAGLPSAGGFAGLVRFGFGVGELAAMEFNEIDFWMAAVADYNPAPDEDMSAAADN